MPTRWETFPIELRGGLVTNLGRIEQGFKLPGSATRLENFEPDILGGYTRILGYTKFSETAVTGSGQVKAVIAISPSQVLAARANKFLLSSGTSWTEVLTIPNTTFVRVDSDSFNYDGDKKWVVVDGVNSPAIFDSVANTMTYMTAPPTEVVGASRVKVFKSHIFLAKGNLLSFTEPFSEEGFDTGLGAGTINVGDVITGLIVFREQLIVFCLNKILRLAGNSVSDFVLQPITDNTGCLSGDTVQEVGGDVMYLGPDGVRYLSASERENDFGLTRASESIQKEVSAITNLNTRYSSVTLSSKNQYRLYTFLDSTTVANSLGFLATKFSNQSAETISWAELRGVKIYSISKIQAADKEYIYFSNETGFVFRLESGNTFDGGVIRAYYETPYIPITDPKIRKTFYKHTLFTKTSGAFDLRVQLKFDYSAEGSSHPPAFRLQSASGLSLYGDPSTLYGTAVYGSPSQNEYFSNLTGSGFSVSLSYLVDSETAPFNINYAILEYRENERR